MRKCNISLALISAVTTVALAGCGGAGQTRKAALMGRVADASGLPVEGVTVSLASNPAVHTTTNSQGVYRLSGVPSGDHDFVVNYSKGSYATTQAVAKVANGRESTVDAYMLKEGRTIVLDGTIENVVQDNRPDGKNVKITFPANSIVNAAGAPIAAPIVTITSSSPSDSRFNYTFPGLFVGQNGGNEVPLINHGLVNVKLTDGSGAAAKLDPAKPATVEVPVPEGSFDPGLPAVPIWSLNPATGKWTPEALATRDTTVTPAVYRAQVTHFSWWAINTYPTTVHYILVKVVQDPTILPYAPVIGADVRVRADRGSWQARGVTDISGSISFTVPPPGPYWVEAKLAYYEDKGIYSQSTTGPLTTVIYWLKPSLTGAPGGCPDC